MYHESNLHAMIHSDELDLIHQGADDIHPTAAFLQEIFLLDRIWQIRFLETRSLVMDEERDALFIVDAPKIHRTVWIEFVAMDDAVIHDFCNTDHDFVEYGFLEMDRVMKFEDKILYQPHACTRAGDLYVSGFWQDVSISSLVPRE